MFVLKRKRREFYHVVMHLNVVGYISSMILSFRFISIDYSQSEEVSMVGY